MKSFPHSALALLLVSTMAKIECSPIKKSYVIQYGISDLVSIFFRFPRHLNFRYESRQSEDQENIAPLSGQQLSHAGQQGFSYNFGQLYPQRPG